jgi:hypothetical protein
MPPLAPTKGDDLLGIWKRFASRISHWGMAIWKLRDEEMPPQDLVVAHFPIRASLSCARRSEYLPGVQAHLPRHPLGRLQGLQGLFKVAGIGHSFLANAG